MLLYRLYAILTLRVWIWFEAPPSSSCATVGKFHLLKIELLRGIEGSEVHVRVWRTANDGFLSFIRCIDDLIYGRDNEGAF